MSTCPVHHQEFALIPAGTSKTTGNPYPAFYACPTRGCKQKPDSAPSSAPVTRREQPALQALGGPPEASGAPQRVLLILGCMDFASRVYQGTADAQGAIVAAQDVYDVWKDKV